ncbi:MAG TPA: hypothetical protein DCO77_03350 [Nitrospiraceae bacterium]|nr:hypothetical protein [Nitrospiraceae bacterium]
MSILRFPKYAVLAMLWITACTHDDDRTLREGDIIFQVSGSSQSRAIQLATHSPYSHVGIIFMRQGKYYVFEAVQPVRMTPLDTWVQRGEEGHYVIKRLKKSAVFLTPEVLAKMKQVGNRFRGKDYDLAFNWSDERIYCSELVWKIYKRGAGLEIGRLQRMKDFDLSHPAVKKKLRERYGDTIPLDEPVISPADIFDSRLLETVAAVK